MLTVTGIVEIAPDGVEAAKAAVQKMVTETLKEDGCRLYEFSQVIGSETRFRVYEEWDSLTALQAHFETPHMAEFRATLGSVGVISRDISHFEAGEKTPI
ncbi:putative quinol monooxygenase [Ruegeria sp. 2205SS24-7]|uniref:putative quinol monooxygenase n=1 Tax=Ruegeria discodermiae TaxID=3064389 RepID=UPI0027410C6B|nr:putative quinol monooxygenase [Ruegeria sp. 2205SS24-7]MDP5216361.1 putative quinol monooxygenase [Ruegeria sp. 2205SS24-7]